MAQSPSATLRSDEPNLGLGRWDCPIRWHRREIVEQGRWRDLHADLTELPGVEWIGVTAGQYDYAMIVRADSLDHLRDVALQELQQTKGVRAAQTIVLLDEVDRRNQPI